MPWEPRHRALLLDYWNKTDYEDFGDASDESRNKFARRIREMMGEAAAVGQAPWTPAQDALVAGFAARFYVFPPALTVTGETYTGRPKFRDPAYAEAVRRTLAVRLTLTQNITHSRLRASLAGVRHDGKEEDDAAIRGLMKVFLLRGFIPYARTDGIRIVGPPERAFLDLFLSHMPDNAPDIEVFCAQSIRETRGQRYAWRGDSRTFEQLQSVGGFQAKVISPCEAFLDATNLTKPWHIFSEAEFRNHMYFRRNSKDNCLDTCVSISLVGYCEAQTGTEFMTNCCFPKLSDIPRGWRREVTVTGVKGGSNNTYRKFIDFARLFLVSLPPCEPYIDTGKAQRDYRSDPFPECAVRGVSQQRILGYVSFCRVHHGNGADPGEAFDAIPISGDANTRLRHARGARDIFEAAVTRFTRKWQAGGSAPADPLLDTYTQVGDKPVVENKLAQMP